MRPRRFTAAALAVSLFAFWLLLSGMLEPFLLAAGAGSALLVALFASRMDLADREGHPVHLTLAAALYWTWLAREIVRSGWTVAKLVLDPRLPITPTLLRFVPSQQSAVGLATHANSITLTPGTITVQADRREFIVHALTREAAREVLEGEMDRRVRRLEGSRP